jgi:hypothetical protein
MIADLVFDEEKTDEFESALDALGRFIGLSVQRPEKQIKEGPDNLWAFHDPQYFVIECKSGSTSENGISKSDLGQLSQSMDWFKKGYSGAMKVTPVMVHPLKSSGVGATLVDGMRIITKPKLNNLRKAFNAFCIALGDANVLNDVDRIGALLTQHNFTANAFLATYTVVPKK